jgi:hypothetical protein
LTDPNGKDPKKIKRIIDVFIVMEQSKEGRQAWTKLRKDARNQGVIINIFRQGDGTATSKNFVKSVMTAGRTTVFIGHAANTGQTEKTHKGMGIAFQVTPSPHGWIGTDILANRENVPNPATRTLDGANIRASNLGVFSCNFGTAFDKVGSSNNANFFYINNGRLGGSGEDSVHQAGFRAVEAFANGTDPLEAARKGFAAFPNPQNLDGDQVEQKVLPRLP